MGKSEKLLVSVGPCQTIATEQAIIDAMLKTIGDDLGQWHVFIELEDQGPELHTTLRRLMDPSGDVVVDRYDGPPPGVPGTFEVDVRLDAPGGIAAFELALGELGVPVDGAGLVSARTRDEARYAAELSELVGVSELAAILGVSRQRASALHSSLSTFPKPTAVLASGPVWRRADVDRFKDNWDRRPGRPSTLPTGLEGHVQLSCGHWRPAFDPVDESGHCPTCGWGVLLTGQAAAAQFRTLYTGRAQLLSDGRYRISIAGIANTVDVPAGGVNVDALATWLSGILDRPRGEIDLRIDFDLEDPPPLP